MGSSACSVKSPTMRLAYAGFSAKHVTLRSKSKDWLDGNHDNVSK